MLARRVDRAVKGLVKVVGNMVETGCRKVVLRSRKVIRAVLRSRKVVRAVLEDRGGRVDTLNEFHIAITTNCFVTSQFWSDLFQDYVMI